MDLATTITDLISNWPNVLTILVALYGLLAAIVKVVPTLNEGWLLNVIKFLALITNRQTNDAGIRALKASKK